MLRQLERGEAFGDVEPGGQASVFTKRALMKNFGEVFAYANHYGAYRVQLDYNRKLRDGFAFRFNAVEREERTFQDASTFGLSGQTLTTVTTVELLDVKAADVDPALLRIPEGFTRKP